MVSRIRSIGWGTLAAVVVTSSGCMGGSSPLASARPTGTPPQLAAQGGTGPASATAPGSGITQALWDNPVSRTVKSAFSDDASISYAGAGGNMSSSDPLSLSHPGKPPSADLYVSMGLMAERSGNLEKANEFYDRAVKQEPQNADALLAYGHFHDRQGRLDVALKFYLEALRFDPNHAGAHNDLGLCYARQGELPRALQEVRRAAELRPDRPIYRNNVAKVLVEMDRGDHAVQELASVLPSAQAHYNVGWFFAQSGKQQQATHHFSTALQLEPQMENARTWLARLQPGSRSAMQPATTGQSTTTYQTRPARAAIWDRQMGSASPGAGRASGPPPSSPVATRGADDRLPVITNVRPVSTSEYEPSRVAARPYATSPAGPSQPGAAQAGGASNNPQASAGWGQTSTHPNGNPPHHRFQSPLPASFDGDYQYRSDSAIGGPNESSRELPFDGQSHESPWGTIPSPYRGASNETPMQYPSSSLAVAAPQAATRSSMSQPSTIVNPYTQTAPEQPGRIRQASAFSP